MTTTPKIPLLHSTVLTTRTNDKGKLLAPTRSTLCGKGKDAKMTTVEGDVTCPTCLERLALAVPSMSNAVEQEAAFDAIHVQMTEEAARETRTTSEIIAAMEQEMARQDKRRTHIVVEPEAQEAAEAVVEPEAQDSQGEEAGEGETQAEAPPLAPFHDCPHVRVMPIQEAPFNYRCLVCNTKMAGQPLQSVLVLTEQAPTPETIPTPEDEHPPLAETWTSAPATFDTPHTQVLDAHLGVYAGRDMRRVTTPIQHLSNQRSIYTDAKHIAVGKTVWETMVEAPCFKAVTGAHPDAPALPDMPPRTPAPTVVEALADPDAVSEEHDPRVQFLVDLVARGYAAILTALDEKQVRVSLPTVRLPRPTRPPGGREVRSAFLDRINGLSQEVRAGMLADRAAGLSYVAIDLKYGFTDAKATRGKTSWTVYKMTTQVKEED